MEAKTIKINLSKNEIEWICTSLEIRYKQIKNEYKNTAMLHELKMLKDDFKSLANR